MEGESEGRSEGRRKSMKEGGKDKVGREKERNSGNYQEEEKLERGKEEKECCGFLYLDILHGVIPLPFPSLPSLPFPLSHSLSP